jgi:hypothetical protein
VIILISLIGAILAVIADFLIKEGHPWIGAILYASCAYPAFWCFRNAQFGYVTVLWASALVIVGVLVGRYIFYEPITIMRIIGVITAITAIMLAK